MAIFLIAAGALLGLGVGAVAAYALSPRYGYPYPVYPGYPGYYAPVYYPARHIYYSWA